MKSSPSKVSVIIVSYNVAASLRRCLKSVLATKHPGLEILVIDNSSSDNSVAVAKSFKSPAVQVFTNSVNIGFPKAVNQGLARATGDYILLLNPDTSISADFFVKSVSFFDRYPTAAIMGPKLIDPDGQPQGSVFPEPSIINYVREFWLGEKGLTSKFTPTAPGPVPVNSVSGACMFIPRRTLERIGVFTEQIFMYYEDLDYCRRIRQAGLEIYFNPEVTVIHEHGQSSAQIGPLARSYLAASSLWYNGPIKHYLLWFIARTGQLFSHRTTLRDRSLP